MLQLHRLGRHRHHDEAFIDASCAEAVESPGSKVREASVARPVGHPLDLLHLEEPFIVFNHSTRPVSAVGGLESNVGATLAGVHALVVVGGTPGPVDVATIVEEDRRTAGQWPRRSAAEGGVPGLSGYARVEPCRLMRLCVPN